MAEPSDAEARALLSEGRSSAPILATVARALREAGGGVDVLVDLGCGRGDSARALSGCYRRYVGCDVARYDAFPVGPGVEFRQADLNRPPFPFDEASADAVVSIETIEHLENPRALVREMARIARPGGLVIVTTPNQLSLMSKAYLVFKNQFHAFQRAPGLYPAHITALVEEDLRRIALEAGLEGVRVIFTDCGRVPLTPWHWPRRLGARGRWYSDNVVVVARRPQTTSDAPGAR